MSTTITDPASESTVSAQSAPEYVTPDGQPNVALLQDRSPEWMRLPRSVLWVASLLGLLFIYLSYFVPLWHTDLWGHLSYGRWIWNRGALPNTEPLMPLAEGIPFIGTAWLSQLAGYVTYDRFGVAGIQFLYAAAILIAVSLLTLVVHRRTRNAWAGLLTLTVFCVVEYQQLVIVRPQLAGMVCFTVIMVIANSVTWRKSFYGAVPILFALWANLHGSFVVGLAFLGAMTFGRAVDVWRRTGRFSVIFAETRVRQLFVATELAAVAVLLNPYGLAIYSHVFAISGHPNLESLLEWEPLTLRMKQGQAAAAVSLLLVFLFRVTPRRITSGEVLTLVGLGAAALWTSRMIVWWGPVVAYSFGLHSAAVWQQWQGRRAPAPRTGATSVALVGIIWIFFAISPLFHVMRHGRPEDPQATRAQLRKSVSSQTPIEIADYLRRNPPEGQVFNSYEWGDYLLWAGPENLQVFVASHAHLVPEEVWQDYLLIATGEAAWESKLDRYGVNAVIVDQRYRKELIRALDERAEIWEKRFAHGIGAVFYRINPI